MKKILLTGLLLNLFSIGSASALECCNIGGMETHGNRFCIGDRVAVDPWLTPGKPRFSGIITAMKCSTEYWRVDFTVRRRKAPTVVRGVSGREVFHLQGCDSDRRGAICVGQTVRIQQYEPRTNIPSGSINAIVRGIGVTEAMLEIDGEIRTVSKFLLADQ